MRRWPVILFALASAAAVCAEVPWLGANLLPNPGFEAVAGDLAAHKHWHGSAPRDKGAVIATDRSVRLAGKQSLRIFLPRCPSHATVASGLAPVVGARWYFASLGFRQQGFNRKGQRLHEGVNAHPSLEWLDKAKRVVGRSQCLGRFPYGPSPWDLRDGFAQAPAEAAFARIRVSMLNGSEKKVGEAIPSTLWLDAVQLRQYDPPATPAWATGETERLVDGDMERSAVRAYFVAASPGFGGRGGAWAKVVVDPDAERGAAVRAPAGAGKGMMLHSSYFLAIPPGLYRLRARVKVSDNTPAGRAGHVEIIAQLSAVRLTLGVWPRQLAASGRYQVFERDFILRDDGWWCIRAFTEGGQSWAIDSLKLVPLHELADRQLLAIYPGCAGEVDAKLRPPRGRPYRALFVAGFGYDFYRPVAALHLLSRDTTTRPAWVSHLRTAHLKGFPEPARELFGYSIVYLANVPVRCLSLRQKSLLREYVRRGGAIVFLGGHQGYERGGAQGSLLEEAMPVRLARSIAEGLECSSRGMPVRVAADVPWLGDISLAQKPAVYFLHKATPKEGARVLAWAGEEPFLVVGAYGQGRVACVLGLPWGAPPAGATGFWRWDDWPYLLRNASWWALRHSATDEP